MRILSIVMGLAGLTLPMAAQSPANLLVKSSKDFYTYMKTNILKAAEMMPEENYSFRPTPDIRTFGQVVGHIADVNTQLCGIGGGKAIPSPDAEKTKTSKADLIAALKFAFNACDAAYATMTDAKAAEAIKFLGGEHSRLSAFDFNVAHNYEHYGNLATYMRLKGMVPPSSEGGGHQ
jgi:uncharacterized damage-inducible protein DinB